MSGCSSLNNSDHLSIELNPGIDTVEINSNFTDAGASAFLNDEYHPVEIISNSIDITEVGTYQIVYQTTYENKIIQITRYVDVIDETPPIITLNPGVDTIPINTKWIDAGITVQDNSQEDVSIIKDGQVYFKQAGQYQIIYTVIDENGNTSTITRFVYVVEN